MSSSWGQLLNFFKSKNATKRGVNIVFSQKYHQLWRTVAPKRMEQLTSIWAHFKELCLLFKMSPSWGQKLNSFRRYELKKLPYPIWMAESGLYQQPPEKWNLKKRRSWKDFAFFCYGFYMGRTTRNHRESVCSPIFNIAVKKKLLRSTTSTSRETSKADRRWKCFCKSSSSTIARVSASVGDLTAESLWSHGCF